MGHLCDNMFELDMLLSDPVGHMLGYLILAFNYSEGSNINIYTVLVLIEVCMEFGACVPQRQIYRACMIRWKKNYCVSWENFFKEM